MAIEILALGSPLGGVDFTFIYVAHISYSSVQPYKNAYFNALF